MIDFLQIKLKKSRLKLPEYFHFLLMRYQNIFQLGMIDLSTRSRIEYQEVRQNLVKINFRPKNLDWIKISQLSIMYRKSRCFLFSLLLKYDSIGFNKLIRRFLFVPRALPEEKKFEFEFEWKILEGVESNSILRYNLKI
ncbi:MAG: DUF1564 family protein [Leptospiraceae bacterium]|nr:DUF1564 family protein [Leptospiraceae bacterium]